MPRLTSPERYDELYRKAPNANGAPFADVLGFFRLWPVERGLVLDLGCGQGRDALALARLGHRVHGVDLAATGVAQMVAAAKAEGLAVTGEVADVVTFTPRDTYDAVVLDRVLHCLPSDDTRRSTLRSAVAALRPGGWLIVVEPPAGREWVVEHLATARPLERLIVPGDALFYERVDP